jgi:radical SAM protein with 4Fe4S-binding SPASM domain
MNLEGSIKRIGTKFILAKTPLRKVVNTGIYSRIYEKKIKKKSKKIKPKFIQIENTNLCNARCIMCPHTIMKREKRTMKQEDFERIVENIINNYPTIKRITITGFGEPFADKEIIKKIKFLNEKFQYIEIDIYTNASLLTRKMSDEILNSEVHKINFSINGTGNTYGKMMGLDYENTIKNVSYFLKKKKELGKKFPLANISFMIVRENEKDIENFQKFWMNRADSVMIYPPSDWAGRKKINYSSPIPFRKKRWACGALWNYITVDVGGNIIMCCRDYESEIKFGNLLKENAKEIYEGKDMNEIREKQSRRDFSMPICNNCDNSFDSSMEWWNI